MASLLILYGTTDGHTRKVAEYLAAAIEGRGHRVVLVDSASMPSSFNFADIDGCIVAGSVHRGQHQTSLIHVVQSYHHELSERPSALLSVSLAAKSDSAEGKADVQRAIETFEKACGWKADQSLPVAGALLYSHYSWWKRMLMSLISKQKGGDSNVSKDLVYTDWNALDAFLTQFLVRVEAELTVVR